jgi:hypothetical protein
MDFRDWLLIEGKYSFHYETSSQVPPFALELAGHKPIKMGGPKELRTLIQQALRKEFTQLDPNGFENLKSRFKFVLRGIKEESNGLDAFLELILIPKGRGGAEEPSNDPYDIKYNAGNTGHQIYTTPKDAIKSIPEDKQLAYRGMSWEEWQSIQRTGKIQSAGLWNLQHQQSGSLTLYAISPRSAEAYAHGFAPTQNSTTFTKPGIIIAIPKEGLLTPKDIPRQLSSHELAHTGSIPASKIVHAWMLVPKRIQKQQFTITFRYVPAWDQNAYKDPKTGIYKIDANYAEFSGSLGRPVGSCSIKQII